MPTTQSLIGKAVALRGGARLGQIEDVIVDACGAQVLALLLRPAASGEDIVLPFESVFELRTREVTVTTDDDLVAIGRLPKVVFARDHGPHVGRTLLLSSGGARLGVVSDVHFDSDSTDVTGYEVAASGAPTRLVYVPAQHAAFGQDGALRLTPRADTFFAHMAREPT